MITRVLLDLASSHAIREGDATFLRAFHKIMVLYMLNTKDTQVSRYAKYLLQNIVDYEASSTRDKERIDMLVTSNSTGRVGCCLPLDMMCEHKVRNVKDLLKGFHNFLEPSLVKTAE